MADPTTAQAEALRQLYAAEGPLWRNETGQWEAIGVGVVCGTRIVNGLEVEGWVQPVVQRAPWWEQEFELTEAGRAAAKANGA